MPRRWCSSWTALCRATALHWRWCECPPKKKSKSGPFIGSANSWSKRANSWKLRDGLEPVQSWWKPRAFAALPVPQWMKELLANSQPILVALQQKIASLTIQLQSSATPKQPRGLGLMTSVIIDREIGDWRRFSNRRQIGSYTGLCPGEYSSGNTRLQSCVTKHGNPRLRAALVELAWRLVRFQPNYKAVVKWRETDLGQRRAGHRSGPQESHRG